MNPRATSLGPCRIPTALRTGGQEATTKPEVVTTMTKYTEHKSENREKNRGEIRASHERKNMIQNLTVRSRVLKVHRLVTG